MRILKSIGKVFLAVIIVLMMAVTALSVSPIYDFSDARSFSGPDIYNPYKDIDSLNCWKRANFHTHTRVDGLLNECDYWPADVLEAYERLGYDIVTFSNHNKLTDHPKGAEFQSDAYEHGYNLFKFHKLAFGVDDVWRFDHVFPVLPSQKQFQLLSLAKDADIIQLNHPLRTTTLSDDQLEQLSGYRLMELDSGKSTENEYWDSALSAGRYSFGLANDDLHYPDLSYKIARRCNFLCTPSAEYDDILATLHSGCFYSMRIPDYGNGDWEVKIEMNRDLPYIKGISLVDNVISMHLSEPASLIKVFGQQHSLLLEAECSDNVAYAMKDTDPYARIVAYFPDGEVIYTNPFARYDASVQSSPFDAELPQVNLFLSIIFNLILLAVLAAEGYIFYKYIIKKW